MLVTNVSLDDGRHCAALINALNAARYQDLSGKDIDALVAAKRWLHEVAGKMAIELQDKAPPTEAPLPASGFRVKSMGQMSNSKKKK